MAEYIQQRFLLEKMNLMKEPVTKIRYKATRRKDVTTDDTRELTNEDGFWNGNADKHVFIVDHEDLKKGRYDDMVQMTQWSLNALPENMKCRRECEQNPTKLERCF